MPSISSKVELSGLILPKIKLNLMISHLLSLISSIFDGECNVHSQSSFLLVKEDSNIPRLVMIMPIYVFIGERR